MEKKDYIMKRRTTMSRTVVINYNPADQAVEQETKDSCNEPKAAISNPFYRNSPVKVFDDERQELMVERPYSCEEATTKLQSKELTDLSVVPGIKNNRTRKVTFILPAGHKDKGSMTHYKKLDIQTSRNLEYPKTSVKERVLFFEQYSVSKLESKVDTKNPVVKESRVSNKEDVIIEKEEFNKKMGKEVIVDLNTTNDKMDTSDLNNNIVKEVIVESNIKIVKRNDEEIVVNIDKCVEELLVTKNMNAMKDSTHIDSQIFSSYIVPTKRTFDFQSLLDRWKNVAK